MKTTLVEAPVTQHLYRKASKLGIPLSGTFELTPCCNMACKMCYVRKTMDEQRLIGPLHSAKEWLELGQKARERGMLYLLLTGGEPFLRSDFKEIMTGLHRMGFIISINSNGTLIDEDTVKWLKEVPPVRMNITLYGASDATYDRLCGNPNGYTQATKAIKLLKKEGIQIKINCSVTPYNVDDLEDIYAFAEQENLVVQASSYMFPPLRRDASLIGKNHRFSPEEAAYYMACISALDFGEEEFLQRISKTQFPELPEEMEEGCPQIENEGDGIRCRAGKCSFWVTWDGKMLPCGMFPSEGARNIFLEDFDDIWKNVREEAAAIRLPAECSKCTLRDQCKACAAMVVTESGNFHRVPKYRCEMSKACAEAFQKRALEIQEKRGLQNEK